MTRIIGGVARGRTIRTPAGDSTRPTADRVREALFSSLESTLGSLHEVSFLDVFAGSGAVGLEAASRGCSPVTCVERNRSVSAVIASNARSLGLDQVRVLTVLASALPPGRSGSSYDVAFLDPPYDVPNDTLGLALTALAESGWLAPGAIVVVERSRRGDPWAWPADLRAVRDRRYGDTVLWYGRWELPRRADQDQSPPDEES